MSRHTKQDADRSLSQRLGDVQVGARRDLNVSRHIFRGEVLYVVRDPISFQTHSLSFEDYRIFVRIGETRTLSDLFSSLVEDGLVESEREEEFYDFILQLHRLGFLSLPISDAQSLHRRHLRRKVLERRAVLFNILFLRIPVFNPDAFLGRTVHMFRPLFSKLAVTCWCILAVISAVLVVHRWDALTDPLAGVLAPGNLPLLWVMLVALKLVHEFGHAYACKRFGGCVPEMGIYLILFTPCAYVDATDSWKFSQKSHRLWVCLGGMYIESIAAMAALFIWCATDPSWVHTLAYQAILLASLTTVAFNANPLMRFDGYYILSDTLEIPNLRRRSTDHVLSIVKRVALGIRSRSSEHGRRLKGILLTYGVSAAIYRVLLVVGIGAVLAMRFPAVGLVAAALFIGAFVIGTGFRTARYLLTSDETAMVRGRAAVVGLLAMVALPAGLLALPIGGYDITPGVLLHEEDQTIYANASGFVRWVHAEPGDAIGAGDLLVELDNRDALASLTEKRAEVEVATLRMQAAQAREEADLARARQLLAYSKEALAAHEVELRKLRVHADRDGQILGSLRETDIGRYVLEGDVVATIAAGAPIVKALVTGEEMAAPDALLDRRVECRSAANPDRLERGTIIGVAPIGSRAVDIEPLTHLAGGRIVIDERTGEAERAYFEITVLLDDVTIPARRSGETFLVRLPSQGRRLGDAIYRRLLNFRNRISADA